MSAAAHRRLVGSRGAGIMAAVALWGLALPQGNGQTPPADVPPQRPAVALSLPEAVRHALENNLQLAVVRQQHGIAAAAVVIARTYPYNPITQSTVQAVIGPQSAGITN